MSRVSRSKTLNKRMAAVLLGRALAAATVPTAGLAQTPEDPTFNGTLKEAVCTPYEMLGCNGSGFCRMLAGPHEGFVSDTLRLDFAQRQYSYLAGSHPLEIVEASPAKLNSLLWVEFKVQQMQDTVAMTLTLRPNPGGGYAASAVGFFNYKKDNKSVVVIQTFRCAISP